MSRTDELIREAAKLSDAQVAALIDLARSMAERPFFEIAPPEALASLDRGLAQLECGDTLTLDELAKRFDVATG